MLGPSGDVSTLYRTMQKYLLDAVTHPIKHPHTEHVTLRGFYEPQRQEEITSLVHAWASRQSPIDVTIDAIDVFLDAIYAPLDAFAVGAIRALTERGLDVPRDVLVATNYDGRRAAASVPPITALDLNLPGLAQTAVELLMDLLGGQPGRTTQAPDVQLRVRQSTQRKSHPPRRG